MPGEPTAELARAGVAAARGHGADVIAAIGGGSVIDAAKAVAMLLANGGDPLDYLEAVGSGRTITRPSAPCVAVPTTAGTGAEVTANAVLAVPEHRLKASLRSPLMIPRVALVDPLLTVSCPPPVTAASGLDALTQCLEPFVSVRATPLTDGLAREGLRRAAAGPARRLRRRRRPGGAGGHGHLRPAGRHGAGQRQAGRRARPGRRRRRDRRRAARAGLRRAAGPGHRGQRAGAAARLRPPPGWPARPGQPVLGRYAEAARLLTGQPDASVEDGLAWIRQTLTLLAVPGLAAFGLTPGHAGDIAAKALTSSSMQGNPVPLSQADLEAVVLAAL